MDNTVINDINVRDKVSDVLAPERILPYFENLIMKRNNDEIQTRQYNYDIHNKLGTGEDIALHLVYHRDQDEDSELQHLISFEKYYPQAWMSFIQDVTDGKKLTVENYSKDGNNLPRYWNKATLLSTATRSFRKEYTTGTSEEPSMGIDFYPNYKGTNQVKFMFSLRGKVYVSYLFKRKVTTMNSLRQREMRAGRTKSKKICKRKRRKTMRRIR